MNNQFKDIQDNSMSYFLKYIISLPDILEKTKRVAAVIDDHVLSRKSESVIKFAFMKYNEVFKFCSNMVTFVMDSLKGKDHDRMTRCIERYVSLVENLIDIEDEMRYNVSRNDLESIKRTGIREHDLKKELREERKEIDILVAISLMNKTNSNLNIIGNQFD